MTTEYRDGAYGSGRAQLDTEHMERHRRLEKILRDQGDEHGALLHWAKAEDIAKRLKEWRGY